MFGRDYSLATVVTGLVLTFCVGLVVIGGIKRIAKVSEVVVPFMAVLYVALGLIIIVTNITAVPAALVVNREVSVYGKRACRRSDGAVWSWQCRKGSQEEFFLMSQVSEALRSQLQRR